MSALAGLHPAVIAILVAGIAVWAYVVLDNVRRLAKKLRGIGGALASVVITGGVLALIIALVVKG